MAILNYNSRFSSQAGEATLASLGLTLCDSPSYKRKLGQRGSEQVIKLLVRSFRRLRLFFCGFLRGQPPHGMHLRLQYSRRILNQPQSVGCIVPENLRLSSTAQLKWSRLAQIALHNTSFITSPIFCFHISTFIVQFLTFRDTDFQFDPRTGPIHGGGD